MKFAAQVFAATNGAHSLLVAVPSISWPSLRWLLDRSAERHNQYLTCSFDLPHKPRTTGWKSQNHHANGHVQQIAAELGLDFYETKRICKRKAVPLGFPPPKEIRLSDGLYEVFKSEADCSTIECSALIEGCHLLAADEGITLVEE